MTTHTSASAMGRNLCWIDDHAALLHDADALQKVRDNIAAGDIYIVRRQFDPELLQEIRTYLEGVGRGSLPNYAPIEAGAPNFHRMNRNDSRAYVPGCFHQFVFFPWNQDPFDLFNACASIYHMKNRLSGLPAQKFLGAQPQDGCTARLAFQVYPRGGGFLSRHADPVDHHQLTVPIMQMTRKGTDFQAGGLFVQMEDGRDLIIDDIAEPGDVVYFNAACPHGVDPIDPEAPLRWTTFAGRWMLLFAVNRLAGNSAIGNAVTLPRTTDVTRFDSLVHVTRTGRWPSGRHDASWSRLVTELDRARVARACLVGLAGVVDNDYILECATASNERLVPIAGMDPSRCGDGAAIVDEVAGLAREGFTGIKLHPRLNGYDPVGPDCVQAIRAASAHRMTVFLDTLFRQVPHATSDAADIVDRIAHECAGASIVLLHGGGAALLDVAEVVRLHPALTLDLSFTLMHYAGSSLDADIRWVMERLDQRVVIGSDMPEFTPAEAFARAEQLADGLAGEKWANMAYGNLQRLFPALSSLPAA